ncbi:nuclease SbcCD subunit C [Tersicoccus solisilvae]|uniref:Nuclease SbcCD subunit C n=1 Tax=Tersicoccus solisilvae TaxID=1882339 RepID=A0ABQ1P9X0_9MICC|nr:SMC family ATPase [Tersicoccus solisilvae]GGC91717.1 nuclease SbcCD subunit C [Tersicoccus solisilvae]
MRIHALDVEAFGPFATAQHIDMDALSEQGLFLLNGPTGAGKTSVLDAICFALYGSVPGERQNARNLRSDHAAPEAAPSVSLDFTAGGRRLRVTRAPAWERPARRGAARLVPENARVSLEVFEDGAWQPRSTRADEVGAEVLDTLGMTKDQFTRVVMLPQGEFARFLQARPAEREDLLEKLFGTDRYGDLEQRLAQDALDAEARVGQDETRLELLGRQGWDLWTDLPLPLPADRHGADLDPQADLDDDASGEAGEPTGGAHERASTVEDEERSLADLRDTVDASRATAADALALRRAELAGLERAGAEAAERFDRHRCLADARGDRAAIKAESDEADARRSRLDAHHRATAVSGQLAALDRAERQLAAAERAEAAAARVARSAGDLSDESAGAAEAPTQPAADATAAVLSRVEAALTARRSDAAVLEARLPLEDDLVAVRGAGEALAAEVDRLRAEAADQEATATAAEARVTELAARLEATRALAVQQPDRAAAVERASAVRDAATRLRTERTAAETVERAALSARAEAQDARQAWLDIVERRLEHAAAELAGRLAAGEQCPVCGSREHPEPAGDDAAVVPTEAEQQSARGRLDQAEATAGRAQSVAGDVARRIAALEAVAGGVDVADAVEAHDAARRAADDAEAARDEAHRQDAELARVRARGETARQAGQRARAELGAVTARLEDAWARSEHLDAQLAAARAGYPTLADRLADLTARCDRLARWRDALAARDTAARAHADAATALHDALAEHGLATEEAARSALLTDGDADALRTAIAAYQRRSDRADEAMASAAATAALAEEAAGVAPPTSEELARVRAGIDAARAAVADAEVRLRLLDRGHDRLCALVEQEAELLAAVGPERERARMLRSLADTTRGLGENAYRMTLTSYVLAARLEQVAAAASERLLTMSSGRYTLDHSDARVKGNAKSGLSLVVQDGWTGIGRETSTLSGGEAFMASLALALGLADVVQQEAGGLDIDTLFVDEGFGSLDEASLDDVMEALEGLRDRGRVVGVVSHVADLKHRIPVQLDVVKQRNGSRVAVRVAAPAA